VLAATDASLLALKTDGLLLVLRRASRGGIKRRAPGNRWNGVNVPLIARAARRARRDSSVRAYYSS